MRFSLALPWVAAMVGLFHPSSGEGRKAATTDSVAQNKTEMRHLSRAGVFLALAMLLSPTVADAQDLSDCESTSSLCTAACAATGAIGGLLGGSGANAAQQCRAMCSERRRECEQQYRSTAPAQAAPTESVKRQPDRAVAGNENSRPTVRSEPTSVNSESVVLMTVRPKDPFSSTLVSMPVAYIYQALSEEEARRYMRPKWVGPARQHNADAGVVLFEVPLMTRQKFVEPTLAAYEKQGGKRSNVRIDVLSAGTGSYSRTGDVNQQTSPSRTAQAAPATPAPPSSSSDRDCVKQWSSPRVDQRGNRSYFFVRNNCSGPVTLALSKSRAGQTSACYPGVLRPGAENEFPMGVHAMCLHAASVSPDQAISAQDVHCKCPGGVRFIPPMVFNAPPGGGTAR